MTSSSSLRKKEGGYGGARSGVYTLRDDRNATRDSGLTTRQSVTQLDEAGWWVGEDTEKVVAFGL